MTPGFVDRPRRSDCTAGQLDGEAGGWTTGGDIGLPPLARVIGVGRQQHVIVGFWDGDYASQLSYVWYNVGVKSSFQHAREECDSKRA